MIQQFTSIFNKNEDLSDVDIIGVKDGWYRNHNSVVYRVNSRDICVILNIASVGCNKHSEIKEMLCTNYIN